jgi:hypothetical protein
MPCMAETYDSTRQGELDILRDRITAYLHEPIEAVRRDQTTSDLALIEAVRRGQTFQTGNSRDR